MKLWFDHFRKSDDDFNHRLANAITDAIDNGQIKPYSKKGDKGKKSYYKANAFTRCLIIDDCGYRVYIGYAFCVENFCRKTGRSVAAERALSALFNRQVELVNVQ